MGGNLYYRIFLISVQVLRLIVGICILKTLKGIVLFFKYNLLIV